MFYSWCLNVATAGPGCRLRDGRADPEVQQTSAVGSRRQLCVDAAADAVEPRRTALDEQSLRAVDRRARGSRHHPVLVDTRLLHTQGQLTRFRILHPT